MMKTESIGYNSLGPQQAEKRERERESLFDLGVVEVIAESRVRVISNSFADASDSRSSHRSPTSFRKHGGTLRRCSISKRRPTSDEIEPRARQSIQTRLPECRAAVDEQTSFGYSVLYNTDRSRTRRCRSIEIRTV
jgi:hypothetical protein